MASNSNLEFYIQPNYQTSVKMEYRHFRTFMTSQKELSAINLLLTLINMFHQNEEVNREIREI